MAIRLSKMACMRDGSVLSTTKPFSRLTSPSPQRRSSASRTDVRPTRVDVLAVAVKPQLAMAAAQDVQARLGEHSLVVSIMAGKTPPVPAT
ncbi:hypothetical protein [Azospirillum largimobile]